MHISTRRNNRPSACLLFLCLKFSIFSDVLGQFSTMQPMNSPLSGGTVFTLYGGSFDTTCTTKSCIFNGISLSSITVTGTTLTGIVPQYASGVTTSVSISYAGSGTCSGQTVSAALFSYDSPIIKSVSYGSKDTQGGSSITINGKNFLTSSLVVFIGSTSPSCSSIANFVSFKCSIPAFSSGSRIGIDIVVSINSVQTTLMKFAYDTPVLLSVSPQIPYLDGSSMITIFGSSLEITTPSAIKIGSLSCKVAQVLTPYKSYTCLPDNSIESVRINLLVQMSLSSGFSASLVWSFQPSDVFQQGIVRDTVYPYLVAFAGNGFSIATAGLLSTFSILLLDKFYSGNHQRADCTRTIAVSSNVGPGNLCKSSALMCQNGTYAFSCNITKAGKFSVSLLYMQADDSSYLTLLSNFSIMTVMPSTTAFSDISISNASYKNIFSVIAGAPCMVSFTVSDQFGNAADVSAATVGVRVFYQVALVISNSFFLVTGNSAGYADVSTVMYSSGNNSVSFVQGAYGGLFATYYGVPYSRYPDQINVISASGQVFTCAIAHGLSYGSVIKVTSGSGSFSLGSLWIVLGTNLDTMTFSLSLRSSNNMPNEINAVSASSGISFIQVPMSINPKAVDLYPKMSLNSIFDVLPDTTFIFGMGVRWSGYIRVPTRSAITFSFSLASSSSSSVTREKLNFYLSGNSLISSWTSSASLVATFIGLPGALYSIEIEYGSSFALGIQCILFWKWDALSFSQISPMYFIGLTESSSKFYINVLPSFVVPQLSTLNGLKSVITSGVVSVFSISTYDRFQNAAGLSSTSEISTGYFLSGMAYPNCSLTCASLPSALNCLSVCAQNCPDACKSMGFSVALCTSTCGVSCSVVFSGPNTYSVSFMATTAGAYYISVIIKNIHVSGSPFSFNVIPTRRSLGLSYAQSTSISIATSGLLNFVTISFVDKFYNNQTDIDVASENMVILLNSSSGFSSASYTAPACSTSFSSICPFPSISNTYVMSYSATRSGLFSLTIASFLSGTYRHIFASPFSLLLLPGIVCGTLSRIVGTGVSIATAGISSKYSVIMIDSWGNSPDAKQNIIRSFVSSSGAYDVSIEKSNNQNVFKPTSSGSNFLNVFAGSVGGLFATFWSSDFLVRRTSSITNLDFSRVYNSNSLAATNFGCRFSGFLQLPSSGIVTFSAQLAISTEKVKLSIDNVIIFSTFLTPQTSISGTFLASRESNSFYHLAVEYSSGINQNSKYTFYWISGYMSTFIVIPTSALYYPSTIAGSPFSLLVMPNVVHPSFSSGFGGFYSIITSGSPATFTVILKDFYQNNVSRADQMIFEVIKFESSLSIPAVGVFRSSCLDSSSCTSKSINSLQSVTTSSAISLNSLAGTFKISFVATKSGKYIFRSRLIRQGGLASEYYNTMDFKTSISGISFSPDKISPQNTRIDETPSINLGLLSPIPGIIPVDKFSVRFRGFIMGPCTCTVSLVFSSDFGLRVYTNGRLAIDRVPCIQSQVSTTVNFINGSLLPVVFDYVHNNGPSRFQVAWASAMWSLVEIPSSQFYFDISIGSLSQYMSILPKSPVWSQPLPVSSLAGCIITAGLPVSFSISVSDMYGNPAFAFDSTKVFGKWNFPFQNVSGIGFASVTSEASTQVLFSTAQTFPQGTRLYAKYTNNDQLFIGVFSSACTSSFSCSLTRASQIVFSSLSFLYVQNTQMSWFPLSIVQLGDFSSPFNGLTATYFSPHTAKFSAFPTLFPVKVLCQRGSFFDDTTCDQTIDFSNATPNGIISGSTTFGIRWSGLLLTQSAGLYTIFCLTASSDQLSSLKINGTTIFSEVASGSFATISVLSSSNTFHDIAVEYQKTTSISSIFSFQLRWKCPNSTISVIPNNFLFPLGSRFSVSATPTLSQENISLVSVGSYETKGLSSTFYSDFSSSSPIVSLVYDTLELKSTTLPPQLCSASTIPSQLRGNLYSNSNCLQSLIFVRWSGWIQAPITGLVTFSIKVGSNSPISESAKLFIDSRLYIDSMSCLQFSNIHSVCYQETLMTAVISFSMSSFYALDIEFLSYSQNPFVRLDWSYSGVSSVLVPSSNLFSQRGKLTTTMLPILNSVFSNITSSLSGNGLSIATCGYSQSFSVTLRDAFSNIVVVSNANAPIIFCRILAVSGSCTNCQAVVPCNMTLNQSSGIGSASYMVTKSGQYILKVSSAIASTSSDPFSITSSPWSGYLSISLTGSYFFSTSVLNANSVVITICGQVVSTNSTSVFLNSSFGNRVPIEIGYSATGSSRVFFFWREPLKATFLAIMSTSFFGPRTDIFGSSTISASSSNIPSSIFSSVVATSTFTAGTVTAVTVFVKDEYSNSISLNAFNDPIAFMSNSNSSSQTGEFISYPVALIGSVHNFSVLFTASGQYQITAKVIDSNFLQWKLFNNTVCAGIPALSGMETSLKYNWKTAAITLNGMSSSPFTNTDGMSVEWYGYFLSRNSGAQTYLDCSGFGGIRIIVNGFIAVDRFSQPNSDSINSQFSVRAHMRSLSAWNFIKIQYRDVSGTASIDCSSFGSLGLSYFTVGSGSISVTSTGVTFSISQSLPIGTSIYVFSQDQAFAWQTATSAGYAQAMPILQGILSSPCSGFSCVLSAAASTAITSQKFFYLLPTSSIPSQDISQASSFVFGTLNSIPGFEGFVVNVAPAAPCSSTSRLTPPVFTFSTTGSATSFAVQCFDAFSNFCSTCAASFLFSQARPYFAIGSVSSVISGSLSISISLVVPAPIDTQLAFSVSSVALVSGSLACTYYSSSSFLNNPLITGVQYPVVLSTTNPATGLLATFYGSYFVRWEGYLKATSTSVYSIQASSALAGNEKLRIWVNDVLIINYWTIPAISIMTGVFSAVTGNYYLVKIEFEASSSSSSKMSLQYAIGASYSDIPSSSLFSAFHVIGSPFSMLVSPVYGNVLSFVSGNGLTIATAGVLSRFTVTLKDSILTSTFVNASISSSLYWTSSSMRPWQDFSVAFVQVSTGIYAASYNVTRSGNFSLEILCISLQTTSLSSSGSVCNGGSLIPVFTVTVNPGYAGLASIMACTSTVTVGLLQTFSLTAKDTFGNSLSSDGFSFFRIFLSNGEEVHSVPHFYNSSNIYEARFRLSISGLYSMSIRSLLPGISKSLIVDALSSVYSSITTTVFSINLDFSDSSTFKSTSSSEIFYLMRYSGFIRPVMTGYHTFWISNPDSSKRHRTWISDRYIVDSWKTTSSATEFSAVIGMASNAFYDLFIDFANSGVSLSPIKTLTLQWQYSGNLRTDIPSGRLFQSYQNITASPFILSAFPRSVCASACILSGVGLSLATSGESSPFTIQMRDEFSNPTTMQPPTFVAQIIGDPTLRHSTKVQRNIHAIFQSASANVITGSYVPSWKKGPPASYYSSLYQTFRNFNPYSGSSNDASYWPYAYGGLFASAYSGPYEQVIVSAAVANGIHATYYSRLNSNGVIIRLANTPSAQAILYNVSAAGFNAGRFQGFFKPTFQGVYTFNIAKPSAQSSRLWIDGMLLLNDWTSPSLTSVSGTIYLSLTIQGPMFSFTLEYDIASAASLSLQYACNGQSLSYIPSASYFLRFDIPTRVQGTIGSLSATYYNSNSCDATMAIASYFDGSYFAFSATSSSAAPVLGTWSAAGTFSARWRGFISPPKNDLFTFFLTKGHTSEFAKLYLDDTLAIDNPSGTLEKSSTFLFNHVPKSERFYSIVVEYGSLNTVSSKLLAVSWSNLGYSTLPFLFSPSSANRSMYNSISISQALIPQSYLSTSMTSFLSDSTYSSTIYPFDGSIGCESSPGLSSFSCTTIQLRIGNALNVQVQPGRLCASNSLAFGTCLTLVTSGKTCEFFVIAKDIFGNQRTSGSDTVTAVIKSGYDSSKFPSTPAAGHIQGLHATYYDEENGNSGSSVESIIFCCNIAISKAQASILSNLKNDFFFSVRFRGFLSFQDSSQSTFPFTVNVATATTSANGESATVIINNQVQILPTTIVVLNATSKPVIIEVTYMQTSGVARDIDWKLVFTYANGGAAAKFVFLPSPIFSDFGDISGLYSVYTEALFAVSSSLTVAIGETETQSFRVCFYVNSLALLPCSMVYLPDLFSGISNAFVIPDSVNSSNSSIDAVVTGYVISPCTCPLIITFSTQNLKNLHWDGMLKLNISNDLRQFRVSSVKVDATYGVPHFLRALFTKASVPSDFGGLKFDVTVDPLYSSTLTGFKFIPFFSALTSIQTILNVSPGDICATKSVFWGNGISAAFQNGILNTFSIQCRDLWGNNRTLADADLFMFKLQVLKLDSSVASLRYYSYTSTAGSGVISASYTYAYTTPVCLQFFLSQNIRKGLLSTYFSDNQLQVPYKSISDDYMNAAVTLAFPLGMNDRGKLFSVRWRGLIRPYFSLAVLTFKITVGANALTSMWIDGVQLLNFRNFATVSGSAIATASSTLTSNSLYEILVEYSHSDTYSSSWTINLEWFNGTAYELIPKSRLIAAEKFNASDYIMPIWSIQTCSSLSSIAGAGVSLMTAGFATILTVTVKDQFQAAYPSSFWNSSALVARLVPADDTVAPWPREGDLGTATFPSTDSTYKTGSVCYRCPPQVPGSIAGNGSPSAFVVSFFPTISGSYYLSLSVAFRGSLHATFYGAASSQMISSITSKTASLSSGTFQVSSRIYNMNSVGLRSKQQYFGHYIGTTDSSNSNLFVFGIGASGLAGLSSVSAGTYRSLHKIATQYSFSTSGCLDFSRASGQPTGMSSTSFTARWIGFLSISNPGIFSFYLRRSAASQKILMWLDDVVIIDGWNDVIASMPSGSYYFTTSGLHDIQIIYSNELSITSYGLSLFWSSSSLTNPIDFQLIPTTSMYSRDDLPVSTLTTVQKSFDSWQRFENPQPQATGYALSIATAGVFVTFSISFPDTLAEPFSMRYDPFSTDALSSGRLSGVLSVSYGSTTVFFSEPQSIVANTVLYTLPGEAAIGTISATITNSYTAVLSSISSTTYIQTLFSTNSFPKYPIIAKLNGQTCSSSLTSSDSDSSRVPKNSQWFPWGSPDLYEMVAAQSFTSTCSGSSVTQQVFPDNIGTPSVSNYPTGCSSFNGLFDIYVANDKSISAFPHKPYGYVSVIAGSISATFYSTSTNLNSQQTLYHKQTGIFIGTLSTGLAYSATVRQGTLLQPSPVTLVLAEFVSGEGFGNGYKVNNTILISKGSIGSAGPSLILTVTAVTTSGAIKSVAAKVPTYRSGGTYFSCRITYSGTYFLTVTKNRNDFFAPFSVSVFPNLPCASTSMMTFPNANYRLSAVDATLFSVPLRDSFGNLLGSFSNPLGPSTIVSQQFAASGAFFISRLVPTIPASFVYMHENNQPLSDQNIDLLSAINVLAATYYAASGRVNGTISDTFLAKPPLSDFANELLSAGLLSPGGFFATYYGAPSFQLLSVFSSPRLVAIAPILNYRTSSGTSSSSCSQANNYCGVQRNYASALGALGAVESRTGFSYDTSWGVRFNGFIRPSRPGYQSYKLTMDCTTTVPNSCDSDDRFRLWIDGALLINAWEDSMTNLGLISPITLDPVASTCNDAECSQMSLQEIVLEYRSSFIRSLAKTRVIQLQIDFLGNGSWSDVGSCGGSNCYASLSYSGCCGYRLNDFQGSPVPVVRDRNFIGPNIERRN